MRRSNRAAQAFYGFVGAFIVIALAFIASSLASLYTMRSIDASAADLLSNALPSVTELMRARTAQRGLDVDVDLLSRMRTAPAALVDALTESRAELDTSLQAAMSTPFYPGERQLYDREIAPRLVPLDQAIARLHDVMEARRRVRDGSLVGAIAAVSAAARDLDGGIAALADLNQSNAYAAVARIVNTRGSTTRTTLFLDMAASVVAVVAAAMAVRGGRRFAEDAKRRLDRETERAAELDVLAQRVAHDLMSPLAAVGLSLSGVERVCPDPEAKRLLERGRRALERSRQMVQGIYAFSRSGARPVPGASAPLRATVMQAVDELLASETQPRPVVDVQPMDELFVSMDRSVLGVVVTNLLSNAFKFTRETVDRRVDVRMRSHDARVHVEVEDNGPGVPEALESAIFEPYQRAPGLTQPGLGLGLATVKRLVLAHGGKLGVRRSRSGGATFWVELPSATRPPQEAQPRPMEPDGGGAHPVH